MQKQQENPSFTPFFRFVTLAELVAVTAAGIGLFFLTDIGRAQWPWHILPFNALFLGAAYLSSMATITVMLIVQRWAPARLGLWMLAGFTVPILIFSLLYLNHLDFQRPATWIWYILFITIAPYSVYNIWLHRSLPTGNPTTMPTLWRSYLLLQGTLLCLYAVALILAPAFFTSFWPWKIDEFHARVYSAIFLTGGVGSFVLSRSAARIEILTLALTQVVLGLFVILGLVIADSSQHRVNWNAASTWFWIAIFAELFVAGIALLWLAQASRTRVRSVQGVSL
jgi:heme/copper-type cytochrome/quinol oxidase subunit 4